VAASDRFVIVLTGSGRAYSCGSNDWGQLGDGTRTLRWRFVPVSGVTNFVAIATGLNHALGISADGTLWSWGWVPEVWPGPQVPTKVSGVMQATGFVAAGDGCSYFKPTNQGNVSSDMYAWGVNTFGQLGNGTTNSIDTPQPVPQTWDFVFVSTRWKHVVAIDGNDKLWTWGLNSNGQLGDGSNVDRWAPADPLLRATVRAAGAGSFHTAVLQTDGLVMTWGSGPLGDSTVVESAVPVQVMGLDNVEMLAVGGAHNLVVRSDGTMWAWGSNLRGQLGDGTNRDRSTPVRVTGF